MRHIVYASVAQEAVTSSARAYTKAKVCAEARSIACKHNGTMGTRGMTGKEARGSLIDTAVRSQQ
jgi:hypothetical protein